MQFLQLDCLSLLADKEVTYQTVVSQYIQYMYMTAQLLLINRIVVRTCVPTAPLSRLVVCTVHVLCAALVCVSLPHTHGVVFHRPRS